VVLAPLMIELSVWIIAFGVLVFCILAVYIAKAFFGVAGGTLGKLPVVGGWISSGISSVEHKIVSVMSVAAAGAQSLCGAALHVVARQIDWMGREIKSHSNLLAALALLSLGVVDFKALNKALRGVHTQVHAATGTLTHANHRLDAQEKRLAHGIGEDVLPRIRSLEREYAHVTGIDIPSLRARTRTAERDVAKAWKAIRANTRAWGTLAFAGAVAVALSRLKLGWIRCPNANRFFKKRGCGAWDDIDKLLIGAALIELPFTLELLAAVGREVIKDGSELIHEFR
jgi:hypothetical protein